jgi:bifunctional DNase/RNase
MYQEMNIYGFTLDPIAKLPVILLKDTAGEYSVPIWISNAESVAFAAELVGREMSVQNGRKDIFELFLGKIGMQLEMIAIESLLNGIFKASLHFTGDAGDVRLEVPVSEAMTMALKCRLPIMVNSDVLKQVSSLDMNDETYTRENNARRFVDFLDSLEPSAMGKYPM